MFSKEICSTLFETISLQAPNGERLLPFFHQNTRSSLSHNDFGVILAFSNNTLIIFAPVLTASDMKFMVFSKKICPQMKYSTPSLSYITRRRWNQRSVSEVDFSIINTSYQIDVNFQLTKSCTYQQDFIADERVFITNCLMRKSLINLVDLSFISLAHSKNLLYLFNTNLNDDGLRSNLTVTNLLSNIQDFSVEVLVENRDLIFSDSYKIMYDKTSCSLVVAADFSSVFTDSDGLYYIFLASAKRDGSLHIWQLYISTAFQVSDCTLKHQFTFSLNSLTWIEKLVWSGIYYSGESFLVLSFVNGTFSIVCFSINSRKFTTHDLISVADGAKITHILWSPHDNLPTIFFIKGSILFRVIIFPDDGHDQFNFSIIYANISSTFPINSLHCIFNSFVVIGFQNCTFAIFAIYQFYFNLLATESIGFSEYIHNYIVKHFSTIPQIVGIQFSPCYLYMIVVYFGSILSENIDCLNYSRSCIILIPVFNIPFMCVNIRTITSDVLQWDMIKFYLLSRKHNNLEIISNLFPTMPNILLLKLKYIFDVSCKTLCPPVSTMPLLKSFNAKVQSVILHNFSLENDYGIFYNFEDKLIGNSSDICEICNLSLDNVAFSIEVSCLGKHTFDRCLFTLEIIHIHDEFLYCSICNRKVLKYAFNLLSTLFGLTVQILCPLCDGIFVQSS